MSISPSIPEIQHFQNLTLKINGQSQITMMMHNYRSRQFHRNLNDINPSSGFKVWHKCCLVWQVFGPWANPYGANGQINMAVHGYRYRQVHGTLNGVHSSSCFRDMRSANSGPNLWHVWQVFGPWASPYGANGYITMTVHNYRHIQFHRTSNGENPSTGYRDMGSANLAAARLPACPERDDNTLPARRAEG